MTFDSSEKLDSHSPNGNIQHSTAQITSTARGTRLGTVSGHSSPERSFRPVKTPPAGHHTPRTFFPMDQQC